MITKKLSEVKIMDNVHSVDARNLYNKVEAMISRLISRAAQPAVI